MYCKEKKLKLKEKEEYLLQIERSHQEKVDSIKEEIKRQLYREENSLSRTKDHVEVELIITKDEHGATQAKIISSIKEKQQNLKELQISLHDFKVQIQRDHDISVRGLQEDFKRRAMVIIEDSERKVKQIREEFEEQIKKDMQILELEMDEQTRDLIKKHGMVCLLKTIVSKWFCTRQSFTCLSYNRTQIGWGINLMSQYMAIWRLLNNSKLSSRQRRNDIVRLKNI